MCSDTARISLSLKCSISKAQGDTIHEKLAERFSSELTLCTILQLVTCIEENLKAFYAVTFNKNLLHKVKKQKVPEEVKKSSSVGSFGYLTQLNGWTVKAYDEEEALQIVANESRDERMCMVSLPQVPSAAGGNIMCDICFEAFPHGGHMTGYAMRSCDHWFCNKCWFTYLVTYVSEGNRQLSCPGHLCNTEIDTATLISLLPHSYFIRYESYVNKAKLEISKEWKWCQGARGICKKIIRATARNSGINDTLNGSLEEGICVTCSCKTQWCFDCGKEPHWPASCEQAAFYISVAKRRGHIISSGATPLEPPIPCDIYMVKQCPKCKIKIEKYAGCLHVTCPMCRQKFCYHCLQPWDEWLTDPLHNSTFCLRKSVAVNLYDLGHDEKFLPHQQIEQMEEALKKAISSRREQQLLAKKPLKVTIFLQEWYFVLQWCYAVVYASCLKNVDNSDLIAPLDRLQFCAETAAMKLASQNLCGLEALKENGERQVNQLFVRVKSLQKELIQADR